MVLDASSKVARNVVVVAVIGATAMTMAANAMYGYGLGHDQHEKWTLGSVGIILDVIKVLALCFVFQAWQKRYRTKAIMGGVVWAGCVCYSLWTAAGFALQTRSLENAEKHHKIAIVKDAQETFSIAKTDYERLAGEIDTMKLNVRYLRAAGCSVPMAKLKEDAQIFCATYDQKYGKMLAAKEKMEVAKMLIPRTDASIYVADVDALSSMVAKITGKSVQDVLLVWALAFAVLLESVSCLGLYAFSASRFKPAKGRRDEEEEVISEVTTGVRLKKDGTPARKPGRKPKLVVNNAA